MRDQLGETGKRIWDAYGAERLDAGSRVLVVAYARAADTADRLEQLVTAREERWALLVFDDMGEVHLTVDKILDQARNANLAVKQIHTELRQAGIKAHVDKQSTVKDEEPEDMLTKRRKEREERERKLG
jgi:hypothetical protein